MLQAALEAGDEGTGRGRGGSGRSRNGGGRGRGLLDSDAADDGGGEVRGAQEGETLPRMGEDTENWYGVEYNGKQRYVSKKYTEKVE